MSTMSNTLILSSVASTLIALAPAFAQLAGNDQYAPYEPIVIECTDQAPDGAEIKYIWRSSSAVKWREYGSELLCWAPPGSHEVGVTVFWIDFQKQRYDIKVHSKPFTVGGTPPGPGPDPGPGPGPDPDPDPPTPNPDVPDGEFGLTKLAYTNANKVTGGARTMASDLADNFQAVSSGLAAGAYLNLGLAKADLQARNSETVAEHRDVWLEAFFKPLGAKLVELESNGSITSITNMSKALKAVADGLKLVKGNP